VLAVDYIFLLRQFHVSEMPVEWQFGIVSTGKMTAQIYIEVVSVDPLNDAMQLRVSLESTRAPTAHPVQPSRRT
jgi:hypothetical protein